MDKHLEAPWGSGDWASLSYLETDRKMRGIAFEGHLCPLTVHL